MQYTNNFNLPDTIYKAITRDHHLSSGDISVSQLIDAPQIRILKKLHRDELTQDISEMVAALSGTATHAILEQALYDNRIQKSFDDVRNYFIDKSNSAKTDEEKAQALQSVKTMDALLGTEFPNRPEDKYISEKTLHIEVDGMVISGTFDLYEIASKKLQDYKNCSTWSYIFPESKLSWQAQVNVYCYMMREHGYEIKEASVVAIFKDFSRSKIIQNKDYPRQPIIEIPIPVYSHEQMDKYIKERVRLHKQAELGNVAECTGRERWSSADMYAVKAKGAKRALAGSLCESEIAAKKFIEMNKDAYEGLYVDYRPGENKRCNEWCQVRDFCKQRKSYLEKK